MRTLNRSAYTYRRFRQQNKALNEAENGPVEQHTLKQASSGLESPLFPGMSCRGQSSLMNAMPYGALLVGKHGEILLANRAFEKISTTILGTADILQKSAINLLAELGHDTRTDKPCLPPCEVRTSDGRIIACNAYPLENPGNTPVSELWLFEDITEERAAATQLVYLAEHDVLTGLYNRHRFQEELARLIKFSQRHETQLGLLFIDLDYFKLVNDTLGHRAGDDLLKIVAHGIASQVRGDEFLARLGGDEFAILIPEASIDDIQALIERILQIVADTPFDHPVPGRKLSCSIGAALYPQDASSEKELMAKADAAMYRIKENSRISDGWGKQEKPGKKKLSLRRQSAG